MCTGMSCTCILPVHILHVPHLPVPWYTCTTGTGNVKKRKTLFIYINCNLCTCTHYNILPIFIIGHKTCNQCTLSTSRNDATKSNQNSLHMTRTCGTLSRSNTQDFLDLRRHRRPQNPFGSKWYVVHSGTPCTLNTHTLP
jgi:hypothetical protein